LRALYFAKQQLNGFLVMKSLNRKRAQKMMRPFLALIAQFEQRVRRGHWLKRSDRGSNLS
ncbi:hypothetical protein, partial [Mesopusillimonas faecipullorum]|uniref:hypothetical protein n=1 Tax=Mesopusillimonas faecipullorum TaxID=2755040 RepID=UPI0036F3E0D3